MHNNQNHLPFEIDGIYNCKQQITTTKNSITMLTFVAIVYVFMCWISNWNILWPVKMLVEGGLGDKAIAIVWGIMLFAAFH